MLHTLMGVAPIHLCVESVSVCMCVYVFVCVCVCVFVCLCVCCFTHTQLRCTFGCGPRFTVPTCRVPVSVFFFGVLQEDILGGEEIARCPSCTLIIRVIYDPDIFDPPEDAASPAPAP